MLTLSHIHAAHSKVKSGVDFPAYIQELIKLGVKKYDTYVTDGHTTYIVNGQDPIQSPVAYIVLDVAQESDLEQFKQLLKLHQQGGSDYLTFCSDCAKTGIEKWTMDLEKMTCSYYDRSGSILLVEDIPQAQ